MKETEDFLSCWVVLMLTEMESNRIGLMRVTFLENMRLVLNGKLEESQIGLKIEDDG